MFSSEGLKGLLDQVMAQLGHGAGSPDTGGQNVKDCGETGNNNKTKMGDFTVTPSSAVVIAGLLTRVLEVDSVLFDRTQTIEILLQGSLKRKTDFDKMLDQVGQLPFDQVMKSVVDHFG